MKSGKQSQRELDYIRTGDGLILYNITDQWRKLLGGTGVNAEYKTMYMNVVKELGDGHIVARLKNEGILVKSAETKVAKTGDLQPAYYLSINIQPSLSDEEEVKAKPVLDKICREALEVLDGYKNKMERDKQIESAWGRKSNNR